MNILFLTAYRFISIDDRSIYSDLLRTFRNNGSTVFIVSPSERRYRNESTLTQESGIVSVRVKTPNIQKTNNFEKTLGTLLLPYLFRRAVKVHLKNVHFDLILYSTPPITLSPLIFWLKRRHQAFSYLLLKDIFPQNAVDLGLLSKRNPIYWYFRFVEKKLYVLSDRIGCMSPANVDYILRNNIYLEGSKIEVCPNCIEPITTAITEKQKQDIRLSFNMPLGRTIFLFGGNLAMPQGIGFLLDMIELCQNSSNAFFVIVGSGTELKRIKKWVEHKKPDNMILVPGLPREEFDLLLQASDVGVILLDRRFTIPNFPSRLLSYLEHSKPVLAATDRSTDMGSIICENGFGLWCEHGDSVSFVDIVNSMAGNKTLCSEMGKRGRSYLEQNYHVSQAYSIIMNSIQK
jgi:glycosyltransferase involved in cell wall biosynthesis